MTHLQLTTTLGYYRFPTIHGQTIIFTSEGDLWSISSEGGTAQRLTTHHGAETHAAISPDGQSLAFSAEYEGTTEVYCMPIAGGLPKRITFEDDGIVVGWTPTGEIIYRTSHYSNQPNVQLVRVNPQTLSRQIIPLSQASDGVITSEGILFFTRLPFQGSHTKRYQGGTAQNIWRFDLTREVEAVSLTTDYAGTSKSPMWWQQRVYFASDRDGSMNLWSMNEDGADLAQHTYHTDWDVQSPNLHDGRIVYQLGADLRIFDIRSGEDTIIPITLSSDFEQTRERWVKNPFNYLTTLHLSPTGDRVVATARGRVFVFPTKQGRRVEVTRESGIRYRHACFMPDGNSILVQSDGSGELEYWRYPADGLGDGEALTSDGTVFRYAGVPSPNGRWLAFCDKNFKLWLHDLKQSEPIKELSEESAHESEAVNESYPLCIATSEQRRFRHLSWSPDGQWLAYVSTATNSYDQIMLYHVETRNTIDLTGDRVDSYCPTWSPCGLWLYFLSDRHFRSMVGSPWGPRQPEPFFDRTTKIYAIALQKGQRFPFQAYDELVGEMEGKDKEEETKAKAEEEVEGKAEEKAKTKEEGQVEATRQEAGLKIDVDGLSDRLFEVPVPASNYANLSITGKHLFWTDVDCNPDSKRRLVSLEIKNVDVEPVMIMSNVRSYALSFNRKKLLVRRRNFVYVIDATGEPPKKLEKDRVDLTNWTFSVDPRMEWSQMLIEAWRLERDFFYDRELHGADWQTLLDQHLPLVERVRDRAELSDLIAHLVGELAALHTFVFGGDQRHGSDYIPFASLGAVLERDEDANGYRVEHIYQTEPEYLTARSPLARPEVDIEEGDVIEAINGIATLSVDDPALLLRNLRDQQVLLQIRPQSRNVALDHSTQNNSTVERECVKRIVKPISIRQAADLRYGEWEYHNRLRVDELSDRKIGYLHMRGMSSENYSEWVRNYYPIHDRHGLILDVRYNRGGNIDSWILEKLLRKAWFYWQPRVGKPYWNMQYAFRGHMVVLCNEMTKSDGEVLAEGFRRLGLGKIIGTRTWGGEIWLSYNTWLVDNGIASAAEIGVFGPEGEWLIEGHGVEPDIVVDNLPHATFQGQDAQLETAVDYLLEQIRDNPVPEPIAPTYPDKSK